jgi:hypothetical protein
MSERKKSPRHVDEQEHPEPERLINPDEEAEMDLAELEQPPQAEGPRGRDDPEEAGAESDERGQSGGRQE